MNGASTQIPQVGSGGCTDASTAMGNNMINITCNNPNKVFYLMELSLLISQIEKDNFSD